MVNPENTFYSVKRFTGRKYDEITQEASQVSYKVISDQNKNVKLDCPALKKQFAPEEISSKVLRKLADDASKYLGEPVTQAVITVPAYFNDELSNATQTSINLPFITSNKEVPKHIDLTITGQILRSFVLNYSIVVGCPLSKL